MSEKTAVSIVRGVDVERTVGDAVSLIGGINTIVELEEDYRLNILRTL